MPEAVRPQPSGTIQVLFGNVCDLRFASRLAFDKGPEHHASANKILSDAFLKGLEEISNRLNVPIRPYEGEVEEVPMHHPPTSDTYPRMEYIQLTFQWEFFLSLLMVMRDV